MRWREEQDDQPRCDTGYGMSAEATEALLSGSTASVAPARSKPLIHELVAPCLLEDDSSSGRCRIEGYLVEKWSSICKASVLPFCIKLSHK